MGTPQFRRNAVYMRCLRCAGAPRRPTSGSVLSLASSIDMLSSATTGSSSAAHAQFLRRQRWPSTRRKGLGTSKGPHPLILVGGSIFEALLRFAFVTTCRFACPPVRADRVFTQPTRTFTSGLPADWSPAPPPDITTVATGQVPPAGLPPARTPTSIAATLLSELTRLASSQRGRLSGRRRRACALASVRLSNCTCGFPACSFHEDT